MSDNPVLTTSCAARPMREVSLDLAPETAVLAACEAVLSDIPGQ
jgi:hypothetical protein